MRTETRTYQIFPITELSEKAREKAYNEWLCKYHQYGWAQENRATLDSFCSLFGIMCRNWAYDACDYHYSYRSRQDDCISGLKGQRLATYLTNNFWNDLSPPKYYAKGGKYRYSKIFVSTCCPLTGYYIDNDILAPVYRFLKSPLEHISFDDLMNDCLYCFFRSCRDDTDNTETMEYFMEESRDNGWEYLSDGKLFN